LVLRYLPEPIGFLIEQRAPRALQRVNIFLARCGHHPVNALPLAASTARGGVRVAAVFSHDLIRVTLQITAIYFLYIVTVYYFLSWIPQMVADLGFPASAAANVSVIANLSGIVGGALLGWMANRYGLKRLTVLALLGMGCFTALFGLVPADLFWLRIVAAITGFFLFAGMIGLSAVIARTFPTHARATGTGFVIGIGRAGSALAPFIAGLLFTAGLHRGGVSIIMAVAAVLAALLLMSFTVRAPTN